MPPTTVVDIDAIDLDRVQITREEIYEELPHRHEFMQLDGVVYMDSSGAAAVAYRDIRSDEFWVRGHLPGRPLFPGVLMIEAAAQIASFVAARHLNAGGRFLGLTGVDQVKFRGVVAPGARLYLLVKLVRARSGRFTCAAQGLVDGDLVFEAQITGVTM